MPLDLRNPIYICKCGHWVQTHNNGKECTAPGCTCIQAARRVEHEFRRENLARELDRVIEVTKAGN